MDKVKIVLLKKHGVEVDAVEPGADLQKYSSIYKQPLPPSYIKAVASLVDSATPKRKCASPALVTVVVA